MPFKQCESSAPRQYLYFIVYFIVQYRYHAQYDNEKLKLKWNPIWRSIHRNFSARLPNWERSKKPHKFPPIYPKHMKSHKWATDSSIYARSVAPHVSSGKLNKFMFVLRNLQCSQRKICTKCHDTENESLFLLNSIIMEINYSAPRFGGCLQYFFWLLRLHKICNLIYVSRGSRFCSLVVVTRRT